MQYHSEKRNFRKLHPIGALLGNPYANRNARKLILCLITDHASKQAAHRSSLSTTQYLGPMCLCMPSPRLTKVFFRLLPRLRLSLQQKKNPRLSQMVGQCKSDQFSRQTSPAT